MDYKLAMPTALLLALAAGCGPQQEAATQVAAPTAPTRDVPVTKVAAASAADLSAGRAKFMTMCAGCHGPKAEGIGTYPKLAGQPTESLAAKLGKYRAGEKIGPMSSTMMPIARMLTEEEVKQVSAYLSSL